MNRIGDTEEVLAFVRRAAGWFAANPQGWTFSDSNGAKTGAFFAVRWGLDRDCVLLFKVGEDFEPAIYQNCISPKPSAEAPWYADLRPAGEVRRRITIEERAADVAAFDIYVEENLRGEPYRRVKVELGLDECLGRAMTAIADSRDIRMDTPEAIRAQRNDDVPF